jgi:hypothetical protein
MSAFQTHAVNNRTIGGDYMERICKTATVGEFRFHFWVLLKEGYPN